MGYNLAMGMNTGSYIQQTPLFELNRLQNVDINSDEFRLLLVQLFQQVNNICIILNTKDSGFYVTQEFATGAFLENPASSSDPSKQRMIFRKTLFTGTINPGVNTYPHGLVVLATWSFIESPGMANDNGGGNYYPLPWASAGGGTNIEVKLDNTNVTITNGTAITFNSGFVIIRYVKI